MPARRKGPGGKKPAAKGGRGGGKKPKQRGKKGPERKDWKARLARIFKDSPEAKPVKAEAADESDGEVDELEEEDTAEKEAAEARKREMYAAEDKAAQLFVSNLPLDATEADVTERFSVFGDVKRVIFVRDRGTGHPVGSGFVHFRKADAARRALAEAQQASALQGLEGKGAKKKQAEAKSKTQMKRQRHHGSEHADGSGTLSLGGRELDVRPAVHKTEAQAMTRQAERARMDRRHTDPRNLRLAEEGRVLKGSPAAAGVPEARLELLASRHRNKLRHLRDANYFVSPTRLCIRDLPQELEDSQLRKLVLDGVRDYTRKHPDVDWKEGGDSKKHNPFIKQLRLMKDAAGNSRGFAFVELRKHEIALAVLRRLNNNPSLFGSRKRLDVEFAVESALALRRLERITQRGQQKHREMTELKRAGVADPRKEWHKRNEGGGSDTLVAPSGGAKRRAGAGAGGDRKRRRKAG
eukprot:TRINITY_DN4190_c0_g1_i1.p1 TRINITY_DN4190_c0_g1~~TRINITY_DN4190_c0_g1_i1.p1  ORF type:complete len:497 (+),score=207.72 TRINITY_DN4190_c0_g1_i1:92-1492(+)